MTYQEKRTYTTKRNVMAGGLHAAARLLTALLLLAAAAGQAAAQEPAGVQDVEAGKPYRIRTTMIEGMQLSTKENTVRNTTPAIGIFMTDYFAKDQIFYFEATSSNYFIKDAEGKYVNSDGFKTYAGNFVDNNNHKYAIEPVDGTNYVKFKCAGSKYLAPGRGFVNGSPVYGDGGDRTNTNTYTMILWKIIPWDPVADFKVLIDAVATYKDNDATLSTAYDAAVATYESYKTTSITDMLDNTGGALTAVANGISALTTARDNYLQSIPKPTPGECYIAWSHDTDKLLTRPSGNGSATLTTGNSEYNKMTLESDGTNYYIKNGDYYLAVKGTRAETHGTNYDTGVNVLTTEWKNTKDDACQLYLRPYGNGHFGIQFKKFDNYKSTSSTGGYLDPGPCTDLSTLYPLREDGITNPLGYWTFKMKGPTITYNPDANTATISCSTPGAAIYYAMGDADVVVSTDGEGYSGSVTTAVLGQNVTTIKAVSKLGDLELSSNLTIPFQTTVGSNLRPYLFKNNGNNWTDGSKPFYLIPNTADMTTNTTSVPMGRMEWYIKYVVEEGGVVYYSLQNKTTGYYLYYDGSTTTVLSNSYNSSNNGFRFSIVPYSATSYTIIPYGLSSGARFLHKHGGNNGNKAVGLHDNANNAHSQWTIVQKADIDRTVPFATDGTLYRISNFSITDYNIITPFTSTSNVTVSNSTSAEDSPKIAWYFEVATSDDWNTYYHIRDFRTGKYLYCTATTANTWNGPDCFELWTDPTQGAAERAQYIIVKSPWTDAWWIVPRLYAETQFNQICSIRMRDKTYLRTNLDRSSKEAAWQIIGTTPQVSVPVVAFDYNTNKVTLNDAIEDVTIYYTTDGSDPDLENVGGDNPTQLYSGSFTLPAPATVKAIATKTNWLNSEIGSYTIERVATPVFDLSAGNSVAITCTTPNAAIYYTTYTTDDGTTPTTSSALYRRPLTDDISGKIVKAIAVKPGHFISEVAVMTDPVTLGCSTPVITRTGEMTFTISCRFPEEGVIIYYTIDGSDPDPDNVGGDNPTKLYTGEVTLTSLPATIRAIATAPGYNNSQQLAERTFTEGLPGTGTADDPYLIEVASDYDKFIDKVNADEAGAYYRVVGDFSASGTAEITKPFTGTFDGGYHTISGLSHAIFNSVNGGTVKNVMLSDVSISSGTDVGAIANSVTGTSEKMGAVYNCGVLSGSVSGSGNVGSLVGTLGSTKGDDYSYARVINCFSYANVSGGSDAGGIVGYNMYESTADNLRTMVMNCMFYGDITSGTNVSPVYGGLNINNLHGGLNTYNYYSYEEATTFKDRTEGASKKYNCALAVEKKYLNRFEFYRLLLNSNKKLAAWYATGSVDNADQKMAKWVLETADRTIREPMPYPVLKPQAYYPSIINYDSENAERFSGLEEDRNKGRILTGMGSSGTLRVNISMGSGGAQFAPPTGADITNSSVILDITDKDYDHYNFNYGKVQLPYYNDVGIGNYTNGRVVTGWKITDISGGTKGTYSPGDVWGGYNFADRMCTQKDLYSVSGRVFSQGAYFDVPYGVTAITIEPYWGEAAYVADPNLDVVYNTSYSSRQNVSQLPASYGADGTEVSINGSTQKVWHTIGTAVGKLKTGGTVYDHAVVLVGNVHLEGNPPSDNKPFTVMSADLDFDNEPDYSFIFGHNDRQAISPVRFDFINMPGIAMAQKPNGAKTFRNVSIFKPKGWFETTNTCIARFVQFEYDNGGKSAAPVILQGGMVDQFVSTKVSEPKVTTYIHLGGNTWFKDFGNGTHSDGSNFTPHIPISVTGGDFDGFYLSGTYKPDATVKADNAECYISGGHFVEAAGASQQQINGDVQWQIYNADIENFYGGGVNAGKPVTGNIKVDIINSHVGTYCGGPKFGNMTAKKIVTTNATGCTFDKFFGAGYGGISYNRVRTQDVQNATSSSFDSWKTDYTGKRGKYLSANSGVATDFDYEFFVWSTGVVGARFYVKYASLSTAKTNNVYSTLTGCTINRDFYGGGCLGNVDGTATSVLDGCIVEGNVFGGGYSASKPKVPIRTEDVFDALPNIDSNAGVFYMGKRSATEDYTLVQGTLSDNTPVINENAETIITDVDLNSLGQVTTADLTIKGKTVVKGQVFNEEGDGTETTGGVFGGGDMSAVNGNTKVDIQNTASDGVLNVFGGGNTANVGGNTEVNMTGGKVANGVYGGCNAQGTIGGNTTVTLLGGTVGTDWGQTAPTTLPDRVFGGGKGEPTLVNGDVTVKVGREKIGDETEHVGDATVWGNVYGGSALGNTNATKPADDLVFDATKKTNVNLYAGTINGWAFGGGLGRKKSEGVTAVESFVGGDVFVTLDGAKVKQVFGCNNLNGTPKGHVKVHVKRTKNFSDAADADDYKNISTTPLAERTTYDVEAVYGGGNQADYVPTNATLDPSVEANKTLIDNAFAQVIIEGCDKTSIADVYGGGNAAAVPATEITINEAYIIDRVFGGGNGAGKGNPGADVGVIDKADYAANKATGIYGTGKAVTKLVGGQVHVVYGGSNTLGNVRGGTTMERKVSNNCELKIGEIYGAGQVAPMDGDVNIVLECMPESFVEAVYGGAKNAVVNGDVSLTVTSGKYGRVFGGNNEGGSINGSITVNAYEDGCKPLIIGELYGGGFKAPYSIYGCTQSGATWTANTEGTDYTEGKTHAVEVNVYSCTSIGKVFGGGYQAPVIGNTHVWINMMKGIVDGDTQDNIGKIGQVFGGGNEAVVKGNTTIDIGTALSYNKYGSKVVVEDMGVNIISGTGTTQAEGYLKPTEDAFETLTAGIYGGGNAADVEGNTTLNIGTANQNQGINISGNIFGGGYGQTTTVTGDVTVNIGKRTNTAAEGDPVYVYDGYAKITGDVYGGSAKGKVNATKGDTPAFSATAEKATQVNLYGGTITGSLYGGGLGEATHAADVYGPVTVNVYGGKVDKVFGCNNVLGSPQGTATVNIIGTATPKSPATYAIANVYGGGNQAAYVGTGGVSVTMAGGYANDVFGGGLGATAIVNGTTSVTLTGGNVTNDIYGGGSQGNVTGAVTVALNGGTVARDVYGGGALADTNTAYEAEGANAAHVTSVTLAGATVTRNVYGGGLGQLYAAAVPASGVEGEEGYVPATPAVEAVAANVTGPVKVVVTSGTAANVFGCNNINGAPLSTVDVEIGTKTGASAPYTYGGTATISGSVYGGGNMAAYGGTPAVKLYGGTVSTNIYGGGLGTTAVTGGTSVAIEGGAVGNDVYGGGSLADVTGNVSVTVSGGTVQNDVYGGGALANTNTDNWDASVWKELKPVANGGPIKENVTCVTGLYTSRDDATLITTPDTRAAAGTTYYQKGDWAEGKNAGNNTTYKTVVTLTGGVVGNAYGGGLGRQAVADNPATPDVDESATAVAANVYGDVSITLGVKTTSGIQATGFRQTFETPTGDSEKNKVPLTGRLFGANNLNGTPLGNVSVTVYETQQLNSDNAPISGHSDSGYDVHSVYGGGNLSRYMPADGKQLTVLIDGCDEASIEKVFGGGNSAAVPSTLVVILGSYKIGYAFGGGNGADKIKKGNAWYENDGAPIYGDATVYLVGGKIGQAFSGSDTKGDVYGSGTLKLKGKEGEGDEVGGYSSDCPLKVTHTYGAGRGADIRGDVNFIVSGCTQNDEIETVFGGSYDANIRGNVTLTITSGIFTRVFGGNDHGGTIGGDITVNIEETEECNPIFIQYLYGGGREAAYPGTGAKKNDDTSVTSGNITVNIKSATRIGNVYGGGDRAVVNGNTTVNVNMIKGVWAGRAENVTIPRSDITASTTEADIENVIPNIDVSAIDKVGKNITFRVKDEIGTIGNIYGGSFQNVLNGNSTVNIGTLTDIKIMKRNASNKILATDGELLYGVDGKVRSGAVPDSTGVISVLGAHITGNVFGGSNEANVTGNTTVNICTADYSGTTGFEGVSINNGSVYGGGNRGDVLGNTKVTMSGGNRPEVDGAYVFDGVYGGGLRGSVGTVTSRDLPDEHPTHAGCLGGKPNAYADGTGKCTVVVSGGQVGPVEVALADGGMKNTKRYFKATGERNGPVDYGFVFGAGRGEVEDPYSDPDADFHAYVKETDVTISGTALIMASVYGGGENGRVRGDTWVKIQGGQIGCGEEQYNVDGSGNPTTGKAYTETQWETAAAAVTSGNAASIDAAALAECPHWDYGKVNKDGIKEYLPYDPLYFEPFLGEGDSNDDAGEGADGHTYYGNVFGGGSGYYPYEKADKGEKKHDWLRSAGWVEGNTRVDITGGHILTSVYGGNETTDVGRDDDATTGRKTGKCTITMSGGTIGVPRTLAQIADHPVTCYLFGAGKGDQRTHFNTWTNVNETEVTVTGGIIYGSVFGGGEDGHVLKNAKVNIGKAATAAEGTEGEEGYKPAVPSSGPTIGTWGTSYVDGNVFGGGRGFSGEALTAGSIGGNVTVDIKGGTMLGSVYGGGRLASVGIGFTNPENPAYGLLIDETAGGTTHGHITIDISGGTIGGGREGSAADIAAGYCDINHSGNVFGGSMGRITLLNGSTNPLWPKLAVVKLTKVNISGTADIKRNVYGGGEFGIVRNNATVNVTGGTIGGHLFGAGYGSIDHNTKTVIETAGYDDLYYGFTPMIWAGCVSGDTEVNISGGTVKKNVYGGGEYASVGLINFKLKEDGAGEFIYKGKNYAFSQITKHTDLTKEFAMSWPYEFNYIEAAPDDDPAVGGKKVGGKATVTIKGGRIGSTTSSDVDGYVFGGGKGKAMERYAEAFCANVRETEVNVSYGTTATDRTGNCIVGAVYGGSENGHVYEDAKVKIIGGLIGMSVYGAGKGIGTYSGKLRDESTKDWKSAEEELFSWTAGKVYGNTTVTMSGGHVMRNIYGGGYNGSVGKGNYAGGTDDYFPAGYGETLDGNLWTSSTVADGLAVSSRDNAWHFLNSGKATVTVTGGKVGTADGMYADHPTGQVYGGSRGKAAKDVMETPRYEYAPDFYLGYVNETEVTIGDSKHSPTILGSVYGGGRDGHVRRNAKVTIVNGTIGLDYSAGTSAAGTTDITDTRWRDRGNVYGSGSGLGTWDDTHHGMSSGSVTGKTTVIVNGGTIYNNVYGGGAMSSVGPPILPPNTTFAGEDVSATTVAINGGIIGTAANYAAGYGGCVFGASRGGDFATGESPDNYATTIRNTVNIAGGDIAGSVYGGGQASRVKENITVNLTGGSIAHDAFGGGMGTRTSGANMLGIAADVGGNVTVELNNNNSGETAVGTKSGCSVQRIFGCNDLNGTPRGHVKVHVYATQHPNRTAHSTIGNKNSKFHNLTGYSIVDYAGLVTLAGTYDKDVTAYTAVLSGSYDEAEKKIALSNMESIVERAELESFATTLGITAKIATYQATLDDDDATASQKKAALENMRSVVSDAKYDVQVVYGGGNLAPYEPYGPVGDGSDADCKATQEYAEVIIDGCELTSIRQVYGGGNAASTPANTVTVNGTHEIDELFGGGNGKDPYQIGRKWYENPGANVGYYNFMEYVTTGTTDEDSNGNGSQAHPYVVHFKSDATQSELREANYSYGSGVATTNVLGGRIHNVYGGSNEKGNIRSKAQSGYDTSADCSVIIDNTYGSSKTAETDAEAEIVMQCVDYMAQIFGGSTRADVHNDVSLTITNGQYGSVYGGNDESGHIYGSITVNIVERGCKPIVIDNLYGGGYLAPYSVYGYYKDAGDSEAKPLTKAKYEEKKAAVLAGHEDDTEQQKNSLLVTAGLYTAPKADPVINVISATKIGNIYGGGNQALVIGNPHININMQEGTVLSKYVDENWTPFEEGPHTINEHGTKYTYNVERLEALPGSKHGRAILSVGNIGNVYGGGNLAEVDGDTHVEIGTGMHHNADGEEVAIEPARDKAYITNNVFGGGLGLNATVKGNTFVNLGNGARVSNRVFGGGSLGSVGTVTATTKHSGKDSHTGCIGKPTAFADGTGTCNVTMSGGRVGPFTVGSDLQITPTPMTMPDDHGYVFGAGRGELADPTVDKDIDFKTYVNNTYVTIKNGYVAGHEGEDEYITRPLVAGGVYGGSEDGRVLKDTHVYIQGGQIGIGAGMTEAYPESAFIDPTTTPVTDKNALAECAHWTYGSPWRPYDPNADNGHYDTAKYGPASSTTGTEGHTFYGNVFGGGSGYFAYEKGTSGVFEWLPSAGLVEGDTHVEISGGHILTNVYGGNEMTDVTGTCHVTMTGGTLGVPRTLSQIAAHPVTCYLFGAGKGDQRVHFNKKTNVGHTDVNVSGGIIYGSVFGGGEDGHVLGKVTMNIGKAATAAVGTEGEEGYKPAVPSSGPTIGTWGTSYVDGNVFGGGRGFGGDAYTAGNVAGSVTLNISGGQMLGSVYGGGRLGSVGYGLYDAGADGYGEMRDDNKDDAGNTVANFPRGHVTINISGGTIGNNNEFIVPQAGNIPNGLDADFKKWTADNWATWQSHNNVPYTTYDTATGRLLHTKGGNVYAGGMGRYYQLDGTTPISSVDWKKLGNVKSTKLTIDGDAWIMGNVYGGGELGAVTTYTDNTDPDNPVVQGGTTTVTVTGGTIGTEITGSTPTKATVAVPESGNSDVKYTFGSIFGGGYGMDAVANSVAAHADVDKFGALVAGNTTVNMSGGLVRASVYGGGELAAVDGNTSVTVSGGEIGRNEVKAKKVKDDPEAGNVMFGGATMGNVYGGGMGTNKNTLLGVVKGNTQVNINPGTVTGEPFIYHNVYGGGALGSVGTFGVSDGVTSPVMVHVPKGIPFGWTAGTGVATVNITGGTIGISGRDNGMVNGSSRGDIAKPEPTTLGSGTVDKDPYDKMAWVEETVVNIGTSGASTGPKIKGSVYGGGENGHVFTKAEVNVKSGQIGITEGEDWYDFGSTPLNEAAWITRGNVYGAGCGTDMYDSNNDGTPDRHNSWAGCVIGNTVVNISGGLVTQNVYGGGSLGSVGSIANDPSQADQQHLDAADGFALSWPAVLKIDDLSSGSESGTTTVNITGGRIGTTGSDNGDVFGGARGEAGDRYKMAPFSNVKKTKVIVEYPSTPTDADGLAIIENMEDGSAKFSLRVKEGVNAICGSVYGGSENGHVYEDTDVEIVSGLIGHAVYGGGKGKGTYTYTPTGGVEGEYPSLTAGKVYGNTSVSMTGGHVLRNIYGGGNMGSVGKGNYAGGADDFYPAGYGETLTGNLWTSSFNPKEAESKTNVKDNAWHFLNSGKATVTVTGGTVGFMPDASTAVKPLAGDETTFSAYATTDENKKKLIKVCSKDDLPTGNIFGGARGQAAEEPTGGSLSEEIWTNPYFFMGYVNETDVKVGDADGGPRIYGSIYGGGQDGHVRRSTNVTVNKGEIGILYNAGNQGFFGDDTNNLHWLHRGNVYGGGSGIGTYKKGGVEYPSSSAGSVTHCTTVNVGNGITGQAGNVIYRNVYGGGSMSSVTPPTTATSFPYADDKEGVGKMSVNTVNISGVVGPLTGYNDKYGGSVFGASRGKEDIDESSRNYFAVSVWTKVFIKKGATIMGNVFGGGDNGSVLKDSNVEVGAE